MVEIPEDIAQAAAECISNFDSDYPQNWPDIIARAILAERQRCADVARNATIKVSMHWDPDTLVAKAIDHRNVIASAILNPT